MIFLKKKLDKLDLRYKKDSVDKIIVKVFGNI